MYIRNPLEAIPTHTKYQIQMLQAQPHNSQQDKKKNIN